MKCLDKLIGISRSECDCLPVIPEEDQESESGVFIDEVEGGLGAGAIDKINCKDFVDKARDARTRAISMFVEQILSIYSSPPNKKKFKPFNNRIGKINTLLSLDTKRFAGLRLRTNYIRGAVLTINEIGLIITGEEDVTVKVFKGYQHDKEYLEHVVDIVDIPTIANISSKKKLDEPLDLPLFDDNQRAIDYYFVFDTVLYGNPRDNQASCTCGGSEAILKTYLDPKGIQADDTGSLVKGTTSMYANGIYLDAKINCGLKEIVCQLKELDESNTIAHALAYKTQELLIEDILGSGNINRFTMLAKEHLWGKRNHFRKEFDDRVVWLSQVFPVEEMNDCLGCHSDGIKKVLIR